MMITTHINSLIFWGAENSYFLEPRKAATVHQIWKLGHLFRLLCGNVDLNTQLENIGHSFFSEGRKQYLTITSERLFIWSNDYYSMFYQLTSLLFYSFSPTGSGTVFCWLISVMAPLWHFWHFQIFSQFIAVLHLFCLGVSNYTSSVSDHRAAESKAFPRHLLSSFTFSPPYLSL